MELTLRELITILDERVERLRKFETRSLVYESEINLAVGRVKEALDCVENRLRRKEKDDG